MGLHTQQIIKQFGSHQQTKFQAMIGKQISSLLLLPANSRIKIEESPIILKIPSHDLAAVGWGGGERQRCGGSGKEGSDRGGRGVDRAPTGRCARAEGD
jgi:hypothetical protein